METKTKLHFQITNKEFANSVKSFYRACREAKTEPTSRQAPKWRMKKDIAYKTANGLM